MFGTTKGNRLHIGVFGRRNVGKSSLLNKLTGQKMSIVSDTLGTTTDPIEKSMELLPLGPCLFIDTAGIDDVGSLGQLRIKKTLDVLQRTDFAILVTDFNGFGDFAPRVFHSDFPLFFSRYALYNRRLTDGYERHIRVRHHHYRSDIVAF